MSRHSEHGVALVAALGLLFLMTILVASIVATSQTQRFRVATSTQLGDSAYKNESAMNRAIWLLMNDRALFSDRAMAPESEQLIRRERFRSDGKAHTFEVDGVPVEVRIRDLNAGVNINGYNPAAAFDYLSMRLDREPVLRDKLEPFKNRLMDYVDSDDLLRINSLERADYEFQGLAPLPRNGLLQYREECLWIPGTEYFVNPDENGNLTDINLIAPRGLRFVGGRPHFYSASPKLIREKCDFTDTELAAVLKCRERIVSGEVSADEAFGSYKILYEALKKQFSLVESSLYSFEVKLSPESGLPGRTLWGGARVGSALDDKGLQFYEWKLF